MFGIQKRRKKRDDALREAYFHEKGYNFQIPEDTEGRADIIRKLMNNLNPDFDAMIMLFDPEMDVEDADMLNLMGIIYNDTDFQHFNAERATALHLEAASRGSAAAAYNIKLEI